MHNHFYMWICFAIVLIRIYASIIIMDIGLQFSCNVFVCFCCQVILATWNKLTSAPSSLYFGKVLRLAMNSSLHILQISPKKLSDSGIYFVGSFKLLMRCLYLYSDFLFLLESVSLLVSFQEFVHVIQIIQFVDIQLYILLYSHHYFYKVGSNVPTVITHFSNLSLLFFLAQSN